MFAREDHDVAPICVIVLDSSQIHSQLLADGMRRDGRLLASSARTPADFLQAAAQGPVDVVVISSTLDEEPGRGFEVLRKFRSLRPNVPAVMLLDASKREVVVDAFRAGARGVLGREASLEDLCKSIHCVHQGQVWANSKEMAFALDVLADLPSVRAVDHRGISLLSEREIDVVQCVADGLTNREIGDRLGLSRHTVKNYLFRIFDKIGVSSRMELLSLTLRQPLPTPNVAQEKDSNSEFETCQRAAENGSLTARVRLAESYRDGQGTSKDYVAAYMWYLLSERALQDLKEEASLAKSRLLRQMSPDEVFEAQQRASEWLKEPESRTTAFEADSVAVRRELTRSSTA
jgi:two-component system, NarL family, nitrate/nitrite response regulator NarL